MSSYELILPDPPKKKRNTKKISWSFEMIDQLKCEFPVAFNRDLAIKLGVSQRSLTRKARELGVEKEPGFLDKRRNEITTMATKAKPPHPHKGEKGWCIPNSHEYRFKKGHTPKMKTDPELVKKVHIKRNETIERDRRRLRLGLEPLSNLKLKS